MDTYILVETSLDILVSKVGYRSIWNCDWPEEFQMGWVSGAEPVFESHLTSTESKADASVMCLLSALKMKPNRGDWQGFLDEVWALKASERSSPKGSGARPIINLWNVESGLWVLSICTVSCFRVFWSRFFDRIADRFLVKTLNELQSYKTLKVCVADLLEIIPFMFVSQSSFSLLTFG